MSWVWGSLAVLFLGMTLSALFHLRWMRRLPSLEALAVSSRPDGMNAHRIRCSVVIAARDEGARIEASVRRLLVQRGVELEVIVVDDRSTDRTSEILRRLAAEDSRVKVKRIDEVPEGWLGKCHACKIGAATATGDWILFTDADCWMKPDVIARALLVAEREAADHIALTPGVAPETVAARAWHIAFLMSVADWISGVNRDQAGKHIGFGAFNLVRTTVYRGFGGHEPLRLTVLDDVRLGLLIRRAGKRTRSFIGGDDVECHWGTTVPAAIKIMEKNYFAAVDYRLGPALVLGVGGPLLWALTIAGACSGTVAGTAAGLTLLSLMIPAGILARRLGWSIGGAALVPFIYPFMFYAILNSTLVTIRQGGIRWRDTFYPLETLRKGTVLSGM